MSIVPSLDFLIEIAARLKKIELKLIGFFTALCFASLLILGCETGTKAPEIDPIIGEWQIFYVNRGGTILGGRKFHGTKFTFHEDGTVFTESYQGDTNTTRYAHHGDTLKYIGNEVEENYHLDTLNQERLVMSAEIDGIPTEIRMMRQNK